MKNTILFNPKFRRLEVVAHITAQTVPYVVINYCISGVSEKTVTQYTIGVSDSTGGVKWFCPEELVRFDKNRALIEGDNYSADSEDSDG